MPPSTLPLKTAENRNIASARFRLAHRSDDADRPRPVRGISVSLPRGRRSAADLHVPPDCRGMIRRGAQFKARGLTGRTLADVFVRCLPKSKKPREHKSNKPSGSRWCQPNTLSVQSVF